MNDRKSLPGQGRANGAPPPASGTAPAPARPSAPQSERTTHDASAARRARRYKVIVVDDSEIVLEHVKYVLEDSGMTVITINSPFGLSAALQRERPDLALVDITMPGLQGDKLVEIVMRHHDPVRNCPIVLYSDRPADQLQTLAKNCGAAGYIRKTGDEDLLVRSVRRFLPG